LFSQPSAGLQNPNLRAYEFSLDVLATVLQCLEMWIVPDEMTSLWMLWEAIGA
jgi:hypothetical protein